MLLAHHPMWVALLFAKSPTTVPRLAPPSPPRGIDEGGEEARCGAHYALSLPTTAAPCLGDPPAAAAAAPPPHHVCSCHWRGDWGEEETSGCTVPQPLGVRAHWRPAVEGIRGGWRARGNEVTVHTGWRVRVREDGPPHSPQRPYFRALDVTGMARETRAGRALEWSAVC